MRCVSFGFFFQERTGRLQRSLPLCAALATLCIYRRARPCAQASPARLEAAQQMLARHRPQSLVVLSSGVAHLDGRPRLQRHSDAQRDGTQQRADGGDEIEQPAAP